MFRATEIFQNDFLLRKKKIGNYIKSGNPVTDMIGKNNCYTIKVVTQLTSNSMIKLLKFSKSKMALLYQVLIILHPSLQANSSCMLD